MQSRYFGDVHDYAKYSLIDFLVQQKQQVGLHWYRTTPRGREANNNDGWHLGYLKARTWFSPHRDHDDDLWRLLKDDHRRQAARANLDMGQAQDYLGNLTGWADHVDFYPEASPRSAGQREKWHERALTCFGGSSFVFLDPDNGLAPQSGPTVKHATAGEIQDFLDAGQTVVLFQHRPQRVSWQSLMSLLPERLPSAQHRLAYPYKRGGGVALVVLSNSRVHRTMFGEWGRRFGIKEGPKDSQRHLVEHEWK